MPNPKSLLRAGQYAKVTVDTAARPDSISVPQRSVQELQDKNYVWVVDAAGKAQMRDVALGARVGSDILIEKGLAAGDSVVVDGMQKLRPGIPVDSTHGATADKPKS